MKATTLLSSLLLLATSATTRASPLPDIIPSAIWDAILKFQLVGAPPNDFSCRSTTHANPILLLHGLSANPSVDLNLLQDELTRRGYCTFSLLYGAGSIAPFIGGTVSMRESSGQIVAFVKEISEKTGAGKVDVVGHSEGGVMALYVPLRHPEVSGLVERTVALGPAVHGAQYYGLTQLFYTGGSFSREVSAEILDVIGCKACDDMATGGDVYNDFKDAGGKIVQQGNRATIIMSNSDTLVKPEVSRVEEDGVRNWVVQDWCPDDRVGHAGLAWDKGVWDMVFNALGDVEGGHVNCDQGLGV